MDLAAGAAGAAGAASLDGGLGCSGACLGDHGSGWLGDGDRGRSGCGCGGCGRLDNRRSGRFADDGCRARGLLGRALARRLGAGGLLFLAAAALFLGGLAALVLGGLARGLLGGALGGLLGLALGGLFGKRGLALGDLGSEGLADLVHVGLDQRRCVVLGRDLELLEPVEQLLGSHAELFGELVYSHCGHCVTVPAASSGSVPSSFSKSRRNLS